MKQILRFSLFIFIAASFTACVKSVDVVVTPASNPVTGSWVLSSATVSSNGNWISFDAGINGVLYFSENGAAQYDDATSTLTGTWNENTVASGYYDQYGNYYSDAHNSFQVNVSDNAGGSLDLYFDDIAFISNNEFTATYFDGKNVERYIFDRY